MVDNIVAALERLVTELSWRKFLGTLFFALLVAIGFLGYDRYTDQFKFARAERAARLLEQLDKLDQSNVRDSNLIAARVRLSADLRSILARQPTTIALGVSANAPFEVSEDAWRFSLPFFSLLIAAVIALLRSRAGERLANAGCLLVLAVIAGGVGLFLPAWHWPWFNLVAYPLGTAVFFLWLGYVLATWETDATKKPPSGPEARGAK